MSDLLKAVALRIWAASANERGQALTEYALVLALIALVAIIFLQVIGGGVTSVLSTAGRAA